MGLGIGTAIGFFFDLFGSKAERRRNAIKKLEREQDDLKREPKTARRDARLIIIANALRELYEEAKNN